MSLLHATWLPAIRSPTSSGLPAMLVWADTWRVAEPTGPKITPATHPFSLNSQELREWLKDIDLLPNGIIDATACLTLPSKTITRKKNTASEWMLSLIHISEPTRPY